MSEPIKIEPYYQAQAKHWIARATTAEARVAELESFWDREEKALAAWDWGQEVGTFLKDVLTKMICREEMQEASRLFTDGIALGIIPEPDCRPGPIKIVVHPPGSEASHFTGGTILTDRFGKVLCNHSHPSILQSCSLVKGHGGPHKNGREEWR